MSHDSIHQTDAPSSESSIEPGGYAVTTRVGAWEWNLLSGDVWRSHEVLEILGIAQKCCPPALEGLLVQVHDEDRSLVTETISRAVEKRRGYEVLYRIVSG